VFAECMCHPLSVIVIVIVIVSLPDRSFCLTIVVCLPWVHCEHGGVSELVLLGWRNKGPRRRVGKAGMVSLSGDPVDRDR
jgi:hypothetical protein